MTPPREPPDFPPPWTVAWGDDRFGLWAELEVNAVVQRLRWIEPGEFTMGSPADEPERIDREGPAHRVILTEGFWLADSACTQALWLAVLGGDNPSGFPDNSLNPVERVSWDEVQGFLDRLQQALPEGSTPVLPTEAQWEYACRAGSSTAFSFGANITPEVVNYNAQYPYNGAPKGQNRESTVPVKTLPPNAWGLYEMHGNVWEWCADGQRTYAEEDAANPTGPQEQGPEALRAVRGGSWFIHAGFVRSAYRNAYLRGIRGHVLGFRLALRSSSPAPAAPGPEGQGP